MAIKLNELMTLKGINADREACYVTVRDFGHKPQTHRIRMSRFLMHQLTSLKLGQKVRIEGEYEINGNEVKYEISSIKGEE